MFGFNELNVLYNKDAYLFGNIQSKIAEKHFEDEPDVKKWLYDYFASKAKIFYERGIRKLPEKWASVLLHNDDYLEQFQCF